VRALQAQALRDGIKAGGYLGQRDGYLGWDTRKRQAKLKSWFEHAEPRKVSLPRKESSEDGKSEVGG